MLTQADRDRVIAFVRTLKANDFTFRDLVRFLDLDSDDRRSLRNYLDELDYQGIIHRLKRGRYALSARHSLVSGILTCHRDGYGFLKPEKGAIYGNDIFIPPRNMEGAFHGDRVLVKAAKNKRPTRRGFGRDGPRAGKEDNERIEGTVVRVLERKHPTIVGRYCDHPRFPFVMPLDARIFHDIRIPYQASKGARNGQIVAVSITLPPGRNQKPQGSIAEILGYPGDPGLEYKIVEHKFGLPVEFSADALREAREIPDHVLNKEREGREDLRGEVAVTIDGEMARDFDDAVSLKTLSSGNYLLGVHIADVSHYVQEDSAIDSDAYARGTSVYFPDRAIPMLPPELSGGICSLKPDRDRLVVSALIELDRKGKVAQVCFTKALLRSRARMTYTSLAKILVERDPGERKKYAELVPLFETMEELCLILSKKRYRRGAVDFDLPETEIRFDESGKIVGVLPTERNIAHRIIEEFMLLANECVAEQLTASGGPALYRIHEKPDPKKVDEFAEFALALGYRLERHNCRYQPRDFQKFVKQLEGRVEERFLIYLMLRSFMQARYSERNIGHFGLATSEYTHFTSPIRRYPDLVVHRLLKKHLARTPPMSWRVKMLERIPEIALHTSARERTADEAEREIERTKKVQFMADKIGDQFEAIVLSVSRQGFLVELLQHYVEGFVPVATLVDDWYVYDRKTHSLIGERRHRRFDLGTRVSVRLDNADLETARLTFSVA